jgi:hypothetical protein
MNTIQTNEAQAQEVLALIPASFQEAFRIKLVYLEHTGIWSLLVGECSASFAHLEKVQVQVDAEPSTVRIKSGTTTLHLYGGSHKFYTITIL